jgi:hypothetical protein
LRRSYQMPTSLKNLAICSSESVVIGRFRGGMAGVGIISVGGGVTVGDQPVSSTS